MAEPRSPKKKPKMVWAMILAARKEIRGLSFSSVGEMTDAKRPPWTARQVRPPVVKPVRKINKRFVWSISVISIIKHKKIIIS